MEASGNNWNFTLACCLNGLEGFLLLLSDGLVIPPMQLQDDPFTMISLTSQGQALGRPKFPSLSIEFWWSEVTSDSVTFADFSLKKHQLLSIQRFSWPDAPFVSGSNLVDAACVCIKPHHMVAQRVTVWPWIMRSSIRTNVTHRFPY